MGAFASMAQNNYGLKVISWSCYLFSSIFLLELVVGSKNMSLLQRIEQVVMSILVALFGLRAAYIHFPYVEWVVLGAASLLVVIYGRIGISYQREIGATNKFMSRIIGVYYLSVMAFLISVLIRPINATISQAMGGVGGLFMGLVVLSVLFRKRQLVNGEETNVLSYVRGRADHSSMLLTGFFLISIYVGLNFINVLPTLYTNEVPQAYIELVNQAETGKEKAVDGRYQHDGYKEEWEKFLVRHGLESHD